MRTLKNILALSGKELRSLFGDTILVIFIVMMFSTMVYNTATNATSDVRNANIGIVDYDRSPLTRQIVAALLPPQFAKPVYVNPNDTQEMLDKSELTFVLEFPPNFQRDVLAGRAPEAQLLVDATAMTQAGMGSGYITQIFRREIQEFMGVKQQISQAMPVRAAVNLQYNPNNQSKLRTVGLDMTYEELKRKQMDFERLYSEQIEANAELRMEKSASSLRKDLENTLRNYLKYIDAMKSVPNYKELYYELNELLKKERV